MRDKLKEAQELAEKKYRQALRGTQKGLEKVGKIAADKLDQADDWALKKTNEALEKQAHRGDREKADSTSARTKYKDGRSPEPSRESSRRTNKSKPSKHSNHGKHKDLDVEERLEKTVEQLGKGASKLGKRFKGAWEKLTE
ncbi:hypothetical protein Pse7367_3008 [Thalassoporum mexicanum PCC 7367]|uniref:hypothetical protein n=1 Tax=Thalassoporum mexicanum TaxID=3457544 RepID=UPI00029FB7AD|nr:hypothetical protein [Pseudanabaena sp. PCC 7367]AFY71258.1 hypothetical protein Pse7367_3008 [Pseudanabaena sp. PCC 7367]